MNQERELSMKKKYDDFQLSTEENFEMLKMADKRGKITRDDYLNFNACEDEFCQSKRDQCTCVKRAGADWSCNPLYRAYQKYVRNYGFVTVGEYLNRRIAKVVKILTKGPNVQLS